MTDWERFLEILDHAGVKYTADLERGEVTIYAEYGSATNLGYSAFYTIWVFSVEDGRLVSVGVWE